MEKTLKFDEGKTDYASIPKLALQEVAKVMTQGKLKYGQFNYSKGLELTRYLSALERHLAQVYVSKDIDEESKLHHLSHVCANALMALDNILTGTIIDDRNKIYK